MACILLEILSKERKNCRQYVNQVNEDYLFKRVLIIGEKG